MSKISYSGQNGKKLTPKDGGIEISKFVYTMKYYALAIKELENRNAKYDEFTRWLEWMGYVEVHNNEERE